jgi:hypothetical protein
LTRSKSTDKIALDGTPTKAVSELTLLSAFPWHAKAREHSNETYNYIGGVNAKDPSRSYDEVLNGGVMPTITSTFRNS